jgi:pimeloyl-ACP methyl ester carboxylesterase
LSHESEQEAVWQEAWDLARATINGVTRHRVAGSAPGVEIALLDWGGDGELVVLHHANGFCGATLAPIAKALSERFRVVTIDARGHGDSTSVSPKEGPDSYAWSTMAEDLHVALAETLEWVGADRVKLAIGHSFGGALVLVEAQREPTLFENILLCDPVIFPSMSERDNTSRVRESGLVAATLKRREVFPTRAAAYAHFRSRGVFAHFTKEALGLYVGEGLWETADGDVTLKCAREVEAAVFGSAALSDLFSDVEKVTAKVLFLHAAQGNFDREKYDLIAARMPRARVESKEIGHLFPMEEPGHVLSAVNELIGSG